MLFSRCFSRIGRDPRNVEQKISIGVGCERIGTVVHEIMHSLGFFHEHTRPDRDKFIHIDWSNIERGNMHMRQLLQKNLVHSMPIINPLGHRPTSNNILLFLVLDGSFTQFLQQQSWTFSLSLAP